LAKKQAKHNFFHSSHATRSVAMRYQRVAVMRAPSASYADAALAEKSEKNMTKLHRP
jgi:hypothetical protein